VGGRTRAFAALTAVLAAVTFIGSLTCLATGASMSASVHTGAGYDSVATLAAEGVLDSCPAGHEPAPTSCASEAMVAPLLTADVDLAAGSVAGWSALVGAASPQRPVAERVPTPMLHRLGVLQV
jgi:hypothetical protein